MKQILIKCSIIAIVVSLFTGCFPNDDEPYSLQFTPDEISHLVLKDDIVSLSLHDKIVYQDSGTYLLNNHIVFKAEVFSNLYYEHDTGYNGMFYPYFLVGYTLTNFGDTVMLVLKMTKCVNYAVQRYITAFRLVDGKLQNPYYSLDESNFGSVIPDTARILGRVYEQVYKFSSKEGNFYRKLYLAKHYGIIYIEMANGSTIKLVLLRNRL